MWELPEDTDPRGSTSTVFRHSITNTNYVVSVRERSVQPPGKGKWMRVEALHEVALTGLARKILRHAGML